MNPCDDDELEFDADSFCGVARLFPLPNLVLYPHVMQPLHVFEERYREMLADAMASDRLIAMAVLEPGWEDDYECRPPIAQHACLGKVIADHRLPDGRYNLLLMGVQRIRVIEELEPPRSFRRAKVELLTECFLEKDAHYLDRLQRELVSACRKFMPCACQPPEQFGELIAKHLPLGMLTDLAAYALQLDLEFKRQLLAECHVDVRAKLLIEHVKAQLANPAGAYAGSDFPPRFSVN